jgi:hypothetical protein
MIRHNSRLLSAQNLPKIFIPAIGAFIAKDLLDWQFSILLWTNIAASAVAFILILRVTEPEHRKDVSEEEKGIFRESIATIRRQPMLFMASMNKIIPFVATILVWRVYQPYVTDHGLPIVVMGLFYMAMHAIMFSLKWSAEPLEKKIGAVRTLNVTAASMAFWFIVAVLVSDPYLQVAAFGLCFISHSIREPMYLHWMNRHIRSRSRATTLSNLAVFRGVLDIPVMLFGGFLAACDPRLAFVLAASLCIAVLVFFRIREQDVV